jgi:hypothetical protein
MSEGWVKAHREMLDHPVMQDDWLCRLWMWCLLKARPASSQFKNERLTAGQFVTGRSSASEQLNVTPSKWYRGMQSLEKLGCITAKSNSNWTTVTICNWQTYQARREPERTADEQPANNERTASEQPANTSKELNTLRTKEVNTFSLSSDSDSRKIPEPPRATQTANAGLMPLPDELNKEPFTEYWYQSWLPYLRAKDLHGRDPPNETLKQQLIYLAPLGPSSAVDVLKTSVANQWRGVKPPNDQAKKPSSKSRYSNEVVF